tara:strand:- start:142 stop:549 length:408 start_codon:yes stop_codon:yes gene_type:complete
MGLWRTEKNPDGFEVNIGQSHIEAMQREGASFCWMSDNVGINDKNNENYWKNVPDNEKSNDQKEGDNNHRQRKDRDVQVLNSDGNTVIGYITHIVEGPCFGTPLCNWFIIQPNSYPTNYMYCKDVTRDDVVITDL